MFNTFINAFKVKDIRKKILYTLLLIVVYRLGSAIPIPGVNIAAWQAATQQLSAMSDFMSLMSGSAFSQFTIFAMGISPYITASIILQLLTMAIPALEKMSKEEDGREKRDNESHQNKNKRPVLQDIVLKHMRFLYLHFTTIPKRM